MIKHIIDVEMIQEELDEITNEFQIAVEELRAGNFASGGYHMGSTQRLLERVISHYFHAKP